MIHKEQAVKILSPKCWNKRLIDGKNFSDQPLKKDKITYEESWNIATGQGDDSTTSCSLDYAYLKNYYKMIAIDLSRQQALDDNSRPIEQINFTANLGRPGNAI